MGVFFVADHWAAPGSLEASTKAWLYHSHVDSVRGIYDGLLGTILVTKRGRERSKAVRGILSNHHIINCRTDGLNPKHQPMKEKSHYDCVALRFAHVSDLSFS
jgi:hypothetical protein